MSPLFAGGEAPLPRTLPQRRVDHKCPRRERIALTPRFHCRSCPRSRRLAHQWYRSTLRGAFAAPDQAAQLPEARFMNPLSTPHDTPHDARAAPLRAAGPKPAIPRCSPRPPHGTCWCWPRGSSRRAHGRGGSQRSSRITLFSRWPVLLPRTSLLGPNWTRLPAGARNADAIALTIDDGPDPVVTPQVLDLLDALGVHATFLLCIGEKARRYPQLAREIVARGHALENHSQVHAYVFHHAAWRAVARDRRRATHVRRTQRRASDVFRAPAGLRNIFLEPMLRKLDLRLAAWTRRGYDTRERDPQVVARRLLDGLAARDILLLHDGNAALHRRRQTADSRGAAACRRSRAQTETALRHAARSAHRRLIRGITAISITCENPPPCLRPNVLAVRRCGMP